MKYLSLSILLAVAALISCSKVNNERALIFSECGARFIYLEDQNIVYLACNQESLAGYGGQHVNVKYTIVERCDAEEYTSICPWHPHDAVALVMEVY